MKIIFHSLVILIAAAIGLALGFAFRSKPPSAQSESPSESSLVRQSRSAFASKKRFVVRANDDSPLATQLERDLSMSSGVTRWLYWLEALEKAAPADFPRLARLAQGNATALRFVAARWAEMAPRHMFDTLLAESKNPRGFPLNELANLLFDEWPKRDPDGVIAALNGPEHSSVLSYWRSTVAANLCESDPERGLRMMAEWHINFGPRTTGIAKWAAANPRHAAEFALENPAGYASELAMETIGKEWANTDPAAALEFAAGKPGKLGYQLATAALKAWSERNLAEAGDWLANADTGTRNRFSAPFVEAWAKQDASGALSWCQENLNGTSLAQAVGGVLKGAAEKDVAAAAGLVAGMEPSSARAEGAVAVAKKWFPMMSSGKPIAPEAIAWLAGLDPLSTRRVLDQVTWGWATNDPKTMAAFLAARSEDVPSHSYSVVAREMARLNPAETIEWATQLPGGRALSVGSEVFGEWRAAQPDAAMRWLNNLTADDPRREPYFQGAMRYLAYHPQAVEQLLAMSPAERANARSIIETMPLKEDYRARLLDVLKR